MSARSSLANARTHLTCLSAGPLRFARICYVALCYRDDTHTHPVTGGRKSLHSAEELQRKSSMLKAA